MAAHAEKNLMNRNDAEIVSTFNSEIRGLYNFYRIAENVGALHKYYYMVRYSMLKTLQESTERMSVLLRAAHGKWSVENPLRYN